MKFPLASLYNLYRGALRNNRYRWWIILGTLVYLVSPLDISPDVFPIAGQIDDWMLVTLMLTEVSQLVWEKTKSKEEKLEESAPDAPITIDTQAAVVKDS
jgi:uncharacterized membrane protein YkvA (DUF1232 family)